MKITNTELLEYLHDAVVDGMSLDVVLESKNLVVNVTCDEDCGYDNWAGRRVAVTLSGVIVASAMLFGHVAGKDSVQSFREGISAATHQRLAELGQIGIPAPSTLLTLSFQSGSEVEVACAGVDVTAIA
jgi:hypothetical protein